VGCLQCECDHTRQRDVLFSEIIRGRNQLLLARLVFDLCPERVFLRGVRCKLLNRLALEPWIVSVSRVRPAGDVTLVILFNLHLKFNLRCEVSTSLPHKTARGNFCV
jgi:hypothetical protein